MNLRKCPDCGSNLDPDEKCDCQDKLKFEIIRTDAYSKYPYACGFCDEPGFHTDEPVFIIETGNTTMFICKNCISKLWDAMVEFNCKRLGVFYRPYVYTVPDRFGREETVEFEQKTAAEIEYEEMRRMFTRKAAARSSRREDRQFSEVRLDEYVRPERDKEISYDICSDCKCGLDFANVPDWSSQLKVAEEFIGEAEKMKRIVNSSHAITQDILDKELMEGFRGGEITPDFTKIEQLNSEIIEHILKEKDNEIK